MWLVFPNPCCCCPIVAIVISNSNLAKDDNFEIFLNGNSLGTIDNSVNGVCSGRIFATQSGITCDNIGGLTAFAFCGGGVCSFPSLLTFDPSLLIQGTNTLSIVTTQNNLNGNFGSVKVLCLTYDGSFTFQKYLLNTGYSFASDSPPVTQTFTFQFP